MEHEGELKLDTTVDLGPEASRLVGELNDILAKGIEVGPETRSMILEFNETIRRISQQGGEVSQDVLERVDTLLKTLESGIKFGLDEGSLNRVDRLLDALEQAPDQWKTVGEDLIAALEQASGRSAERLTSEVKKILAEAEASAGRLIRVTGTEARCNVDFLASKTNSRLDEFLGKSVFDLLKAAVFRHERERPTPVPFVCHATPGQVAVEQVGEQLLFIGQPVAQLTLTGFGFVSENVPTAVLTDETGAIVVPIPARPIRKSAYEIVLNLQDFDFAPVGARSLVRFEFPDVEEVVAIPIVLPPPRAAFSGGPKRGNAPLAVTFSNQSTRGLEYEWDFGDGEKSVVNDSSDVTHTYVIPGQFTVELTARNGGGTDKETKLGYIEVIGVAAVPVADFSASTVGGVAPLRVSFTDLSQGEVTAWRWHFGDSVWHPGFVVGTSSTPGTSSATASASLTTANSGVGIAPAPFPRGDTRAKNPTHWYRNPGTYDVRLTVTGPHGEDTMVKRRHITVTRQ